MRSMTGYGQGDAHGDGLKFSVELNSVNRKQADYQVDLPRELIELESRVRDEIHAVVSRGRLHATIRWHRIPSEGRRQTEICLDEARAKTYLRAIRKLQQNLNLKGNVSLETILSFPGVLRISESEVNPGEVWPTIRKALRQALIRLVRMREQEGKNLRNDLLRRTKYLAKAIRSLHRLASMMIEHHRKQLRERIRKSGLKISVEDERLTKEIILYADRSDIAEELTRLESHIEQFRSHLDAHEPVGRTLEFLTQEINREINTISNKSNHAMVSQIVVEMKTELERVREQIQNVE